MAIKYLSRLDNSPVLSTPLRADGVCMLVTYGRILREMVSADGTIVYLFTYIYIKTNTVPHTRYETVVSIHKS